MVTPKNFLKGWRDPAKSNGLQFGGGELERGHAQLPEGLEPSSPLPTPGVPGSASSPPRNVGFHFIKDPDKITVPVAILYAGHQGASHRALQVVLTYVRKDPPDRTQSAVEQPKRLQNLKKSLQDHSQNEGCDPASQLQDQRGSTTHLDIVSLGQGQGPLAEELISKAQILKGRWVFLQNCHLAASWMPRLQRIVENSSDKVDPQFRLWLSSRPDPCFPVSILQAGVKVPTNVGYCPQKDALEECLTCKETLKLFARLHGVPASDVNACVKNYLRRFMLEHRAGKLVGTLSGGNKRKLSLAVALMGDPDIVLLDEPSSGVEPEARRKIWDVLSAVRASGKTLVLTSHSMEECEALCTRLTIMMNGHMVCLGSPQHLKSKFTQGYELVIKMAKLSDTDSLAPVEPVVKRVQSRMPSAFVFYTMAGYAKIQVPDEYVQLADLFELLEDCKQDLHMEDYSVQQTSLEQVFLKITQEQA